MDNATPVQTLPAHVPLPSTAQKARLALPWYRQRTLDAFDAFREARRLYQQAADEESACRDLAADEPEEGAA